MKRLLLLLAVTMLGAGLAAAQDSGISLGDAARLQKAKKSQTSPNAKVYDNENLLKTGNISTTTGDFGGVAAAAPAKTSTSSTTTAKAGAAPGKDSAKDAKTPEEEAKAQEDEFRQKVGEAKKNIAQLERELDVMQREQRLRA